MKRSKSVLLAVTFLFVSLFLYGSVAANSHLHIDLDDKHECSYCLVQLSALDVSSEDFKEPVSYEYETCFLPESHPAKNVIVWFGARFPNAPPLLS